MEAMWFITSAINELNDNDSDIISEIITTGIIITE